MLSPEYYQTGVHFDNVIEARVPNPITNIDDIDLPGFVRANATLLAYSRMTVVQRFAVPVLAGAATGSGKTANFLQPSITKFDRVDDDCVGRNAPRCIVIAQTWELTSETFMAACSLCRPPKARRRRNVITASQDGTVSVWSRLTGDVSKSLEVGGGVKSMVYKNGGIFFVISKEIKVCSLDNGIIQVLSEFPSNVEELRISGNKTVLLAYSCDNTCKVFYRTKDGNRVIDLIGHESSLISVDLSEDGKIAATASCDGMVHLWSVNDGKHMIAKGVFEAANVAFDARGRVRFNAGVGNARRLAVVVAKTEVRVFEMDSFTEMSVLRWDGVDGEGLTHVVFSRDGRHLVGGTDCGSVVVWDVKTRKFLSNWSCNRGSKITCLEWFQKDENTLLFCDASGFWEALKIDLKKQPPVHHEASSLSHSMDLLSLNTNKVDTKQGRTIARRSQRRRHQTTRDVSLTSERCSIDN